MHDDCSDMNELFNIDYKLFELLILLIDCVFRYSFNQVFLRKIKNCISCCINFF